MLDPLASALKSSASGLQAQSHRLRVVSENLANTESTGRTSGADPYMRKTISFESALDEVSGGAGVRVSAIGEDDKPPRVEFDPDNPAADERGYVKLPNVNVLIEMADMREANRTYEANLQMVKQVRDMLASTIDLLRA